MEQNLRLWSMLPLHVFSRQLLEKAFSDVTQMAIGCVETFDDDITTAAELQTRKIPIKVDNDVMMACHMITF